VNDVTIRAERAADFAAVAAVVESAFGSAAEARLVDAIRVGVRST
jgi:predicted N-acetyltransferase YhbS